MYTWKIGVAEKKLSGAAWEKRVSKALVSRSSMGRSCGRIRVQGSGELERTVAYICSRAIIAARLCTRTR